jgi:hypothetical protein
MTAERQGIPLLRSKNERRYKTETAGNSLQSSFLRSAFSLTLLCAMASVSESEFNEGSGRSTGAFSKAMVLEVAGPKVLHEMQAMLKRHWLLKEVD